MNRRWIYTILLVLLLSLALLTYSVHAQVVPGSYSLSWWTVDGGGGSSSGTGYSLNGTAGQPDAGSLTGTGYQLSGGYWTGGSLANHSVFLPLIVR